MNFRIEATEEENRAILHRITPEGDSVIATVECRQPECRLWEFYRPGMDGHTALLADTLLEAVQLYLFFINEEPRRIELVRVREFSVRR